MEFYDVEQLNEWYFKMKLPYGDLRDVSYSKEVLKYVFPLRRYIKSTETGYLYNQELEDGVFEFQIGFARFILENYESRLPQHSKDKLTSMISTNLTIPDFNNLRIYQVDDLRSLIGFNRGIFQTYTGYGKSEVIATLAHYLSSNLNKNVLVVTASGSALDEIKDRLYKRFGLEFDYFDKERNLNCINLNGYLRSSWYDPNDEYWKSEFYVLADEVENCVSESAMEFYETLPNVKCMYGFSATSDKKRAQPMYASVESSDDRKALRDILGRNQYLIGYFGTTTVFRRPSDFNIKLIDILSSISADVFHLPDEYDYNGIVYGLFTNDRVCKLIQGLVYRVGLMFIPMFRLEVLDYWLDNYFKKPGFIVLCISSRGYELYEQGELIDNVPLSTVKVLVSQGLIHLVIGTKSSYSALDIPELNRVLLLYSKVANIVIQAIGRTARSGEFEIYNINPTNTIPTYSKDLVERKLLIKDYYKDCNIVEYTYNENIFIQ